MFASQLKVFYTGKHTCWSKRDYCFSWWFPSRILYDSACSASSHSVILSKSR